MAATGGQRPGGLTALAVLNFIFGASGLLQVFRLAAMLGSSPHARAELERASEFGGTGGAIYLLILLQLVGSTLLILSGAGYLGQKRLMGKVLGSIYGVVGLVSTALTALLVHQFNLFTILGILYPLL